MKKLSWFRFTCCLCFLLMPLASARAQLVSPWFRGTPQSWKVLTETSFATPSLNATRLSVPLSGLSTGYTVKTTVPNWLKHRLSHSNTFSRMEKDLFKIHPTNLTAVTGKLSYFLDRDALLAANVMRGEINEHAFSRHQELLQNTLAEVENFGHEQITSRFSNTILTQEEQERILKDPAQPPAFIVSHREIERFPTLSLAEQQLFAQKALQDASRNLADILRQNPQEIPTHVYSNYYYYKLRQRYFSMLCKVMERAQAPRQTIIIRVRKKISLSFLPESEQLLTDAQRLGKLYFHQGLMQANTQSATTDLVALQTEIARQTELYNPYALAEAFGIPYEKLLSQRNYLANIYFAEEEAAYINTLTSYQALEELPAKITHVQTQQNSLLAAKTLSLDGYVHYFRLVAQEQFLKTRLAQAQLFSRYQHP